jgi:tRNA uridine 5-carboxymethylaminomethyl modification enzyme
VVGAGHAGIEAAMASAKMGADTLLLTINLDTVGKMSCNPSIGGLAKGQIAREIDALGGVMGEAIDAVGLHFHMLNTSKGPAVQSPRAQADKNAYHMYMKRRCEEQENLHLRQDKVKQLLLDDNEERIIGVKGNYGISYKADTVVLTTGTFMRGLVHMGESKTEAGRAWEPPAESISASLRELGFEMDRAKTGTPPRLNGRTVNYDVMEVQQPDEDPQPFSYTTNELEQDQMPCYKTRTNPEVHELIRDNLDRAPMYTGQIDAVGVRYCPSIEDKVAKFEDRDSHTVFIEPEGRDTIEIYPNGISTSLPMDVQEQIVDKIEGLEDAEITRYGYAIEYDFVQPTQLRPNLETEKIRGLYFAGQINGTTGYEEAGCQGLLAGINAACRVLDKEELVLKRYEAYTGVLIDDLVTQGVTEPYRMFTSRAEYRLLLRHDNADRRLYKHARRLGLISEERAEHVEKKQNQIDRVRDYMEDEYYEGKTLQTYLRQPERDFSDIREMDPDVEEFDLTDEEVRQVEIETKYEGYIKRELKKVEKMKEKEEKPIPDEIDFDEVPHIRAESREKLSEVQPETLGQARRISGVSPADVRMLMIYMQADERRA